MSFRIVEVQDAVLSHLQSELAQPVVEQAIPDSVNVRRVNGVIEPYVAVQFGDPRERVSGRSFLGVTVSDYELMVYVQAVSPDPKVGRQIAYSKVYEALLGFQQEGTGELRQRLGGAIWPITASNGATEAYMVPASFSINVQLQI